MTAARIRSVDADSWAPEHREMQAAGLTFIDLFAATDLGDGRTEVVTSVMAPDASQRVMLRVEVASGDAVPSLVEIYPAAAWHEREAHDLIGLEFVGHPDLRPIITDAQPPPLRRSSPLEPRVATRWPGLYEPGAAEGETRRRRPKPVPGVDEAWTQGSDA